MSTSTDPRIREAAALRKRRPDDAMPELFRLAMSRFPTGVVLVTASVGGRPWGMTVSACCGICTEPATMLVSLGGHTALAHAIAESGRFGINILSQDTVAAARFGSTPGAPKFLDDADLELEGDPQAVGIVGAISHLECDVAQMVDEGDHRLFLGRVRRMSLSPDKEPLLYFSRDYRRLDLDRAAA